MCLALIFLLCTLEQQNKGNEITKYDKEQFFPSFLGSFFSFFCLSFVYRLLVAASITEGKEKKCVNNKTFLSLLHLNNDVEKRASVEELVWVVKPNTLQGHYYLVSVIRSSVNSNYLLCVQFFKNKFSTSFLYYQSYWFVWNGVVWIGEAVLGNTEFNLFKTPVFLVSIQNRKKNEEKNIFDNHLIFSINGF